MTTPDPAPAGDTPTPAADTPAAAPRRRRRFFTVWNIVRFAIVVVLATELGLRVLGFGKPLLYTDEPGEAQGGCGFFVAPNQDTTRLFARNQTNRWGMRCDDFPDQKEAGHYRVLFIGDSVTYGTTYVDQSEIFTSILQRELPAIARQPVDVLNASAGRWAPSNEINFLRSSLLRCRYAAFDADLVIFVFGTGDLTQGFDTGPDSRSTPRKKPLTAIGEVWERYLLPHILTAAVPEDAGAIPQPVPELNDLHALDSLGGALDYCQTMKNPGNHYRGIKMAIVFTPAHGGVWDQSAYETLKQNLVGWCADHGVPFIDLAPSLRPPYDKLYFGDTTFVHLRPAGHRIVADRLEPRLAGIDALTPRPCSLFLQPHEILRPQWQPGERRLAAAKRPQCRREEQREARRGQLEARIAPERQRLPPRQHDGAHVKRAALEDAARDRVQRVMLDDEHAAAGGQERGDAPQGFAACRGRDVMQDVGQQNGVKLCRGHGLDPAKDRRLGTAFLCRRHAGLRRIEPAHLRSREMPPQQRQAAPRPAAEIEDLRDGPPAQPPRHERGLVFREVQRVRGVGVQRLRENRIVFPRKLVKGLVIHRVGPPRPPGPACRRANPAAPTWSCAPRTAACG